MAQSSPPTDPTKMHKPSDHLHQNLNDDLHKLLAEILRYKTSTNTYLTDARNEYHHGGRKMINDIKATHDRFCKHLERQCEVVQQALDRDFKNAVRKLDTHKAPIDVKKKHHRESDSVRELALGTRERLRALAGASKGSSSSKSSVKENDEAIE